MWQHFSVGRGVCSVWEEWHVSPLDAVVCSVFLFLWHHSKRAVITPNTRSSTDSAGTAFSLLSAKTLQNIVHHLPLMKNPLIVATVRVSLDLQRMRARDFCVFIWAVFRYKCVTAFSKESGCEINTHPFCCCINISHWHREQGSMLTAAGERQPTRGWRNTTGWGMAGHSSWWVCVCGVPGYLER